jgi:CubicO group peptidase (beta-lactamase class C family)
VAHGRQAVGELRGEGGDAPAVRLVAPPGTAFRYSGGGFTVAQLWAEQVSGLPFGALMDREVLAPLGIRDSSFAQDDDPRDATGHDREGRPRPAFRQNALAAAGLHATAPDLAHFVAALMPALDGAPPGRGLVPPETLAAMFAPSPATGGGYGIGFELQALDGERPMPHHEGQNRGWRALIAALPARGWGLVVVCNGDGGGEVTSAALHQMVR